jgi:hypothetical protein
VGTKYAREMLEIGSVLGDCIEVALRSSEDVDTKTNDREDSNKELASVENVAGVRRCVAGLVIILVMVCKLMETSGLDLVLCVSNGSSSTLEVFELKVSNGSVSDLVEVRNKVVIVIAECAGSLNLYVVD